MGSVKFSPGNAKMGSIPSVSLPAIRTCVRCECNQKCYAAKLERLRPNVRAAYQNNLEVLQNDPDTYWREVEATIMLSRFFRFHVSGDIVDMDYLTRMVSIAQHNPHCEILCFTKKFELVNRFLQSPTSQGHLPQNLHIVFSGWHGLQMDNPYHLPEAHVIMRDGSTTARPDAIPCSGNCAECARTNGGCWSLRRGQQVTFHEH